MGTKLANIFLCLKIYSQHLSDEKILLKISVYIN